MERLVEVEAAQRRTIFEELEDFYLMIEFGPRLLMKHTTDRYYRFIEPELG